MSKLPANEIVARNNERLFLLYENQLKKQTLKDYADTAIKLAAWLSDSKAYYTAARPQVGARIFHRAYFSLPPQIVNLLVVCRDSGPRA
jgi:hypothetical protein